jgi:hypothetical protein
MTGSRHSFLRKFYQSFFKKKAQKQTNKTRQAHCRMACRPVPEATMGSAYPAEGLRHVKNNHKVKPCFYCRCKPMKNAMTGATEPPTYLPHALLQPHGRTNLTGL